MQAKLPPIYVITLKQTPKREAALRKHFDELELDYTIYYGFHGVTLGLQTSIPYEVDNPGSGYRIAPNTAALVLNHLALLRGLQALTDLQEFIVCEDDCRFVSDIKTNWGKYIRSLPTAWEMVYLGNCCTDGKPTRRTNKAVATVTGALCTHAIMYRRSAIDKVLAAGSLWAPIDIMFAARVHPVVRPYCFLPPLATQASFDPDWLPDERIGTLSIPDSLTTKISKKHEW